MTEKSPIDTLSEIHAMLTSMNARMSLIEQNITLLHDKANGNLFSGTKSASFAKSQPQQPSASTALKDLDDGQKSIGVPITSTRQGAHVHGQIYSPDKKPIHNVTVIVKNQKHDVMGQPKTNQAGEWELELPPGKYALTYSKSGMSPIYRFVEVKVGQKDLEVL